jgi:hypothetical protein
LIDTFVKQQCYDWKGIKPFLDALGRRFHPKFPQSDDARMYAMFERYFCLLVMRAGAIARTSTNTFHSLLTTLSDGKPADFIVGFLDARYRTDLKKDVLAKLGGNDLVPQLIQNAAAISR